MSTPTAICLDTEVFERLNFNFAATTLQKFVTLCKERKVKLLIPAPIRDEIHRHMFDRAKELSGALDKVANDARRKSPYLEKWKRFPAPPKERAPLAELRRLCGEAWDAFEREVQTEHLEYDGVKLRDIMFRYNYMLAPFAAGEKRKEFPDAISLAILDVYARKHGTFVAVVSADNDMKSGCDSYQNLLHFPSISSLMETFLAEDERVDLYVNLINANIDDLCEGLTQVVTDYGIFKHYDRQYTKVRDKIHGVDVQSFDVIVLGINECTIAYSGCFETEHELSWEDYDYDGRPFQRAGWIHHRFDIGGIAKIKFSSDDKELVSCDHIEVESYEFELTHAPSQRWS